MTDGNIVEIRQLPRDPIGGASGPKDYFEVLFIGKSNNADFPYTVANEIVASWIGHSLGLNVQTAIPHSIAAMDAVLIQYLPQHPVMEDVPPATALALQAYVIDHSFEIHGSIVFDLFVANNDRSFGPHRRNIRLAPDGRLVLIDFGNCCFYRHRPAAGIVAGIPRLTAVERDLRSLFDMSHKGNHYWELLTDWHHIEEWCDRIRQIPEFTISAAVDKIPVNSASVAERDALIEFLARRRGYLLEHIKSCKDAFPGLP